ncbi:MAG: rod shape-determining protein RodA [Pseudomonadota bacterium]
MQFDRRLLENFDWIFLCLVLALATLGIVNLYSASSGFQAGGTPVYMKQLYWFLMGMAFLGVILLFDYHVLCDSAYMIYGFGVLLLVFVMIFGLTSSGAQRWIDLGVFRLQPSELIKVFVIIALAKYFARREYPTGLSFSDLIGPTLFVGLPFLLILKQPDLGTALHLALSSLPLLLLMRVRRTVLLAICGGLAAAAPFAWFSLKAYQKQRIFTFLNPENDPLGAGYHIIQSKIAVGSGQFWGKGYMKGTQSQLRFLPEQHTDFAFSVFAEEWGFVGSIVLLILFLLLILTALQIVRRSQDRFGALLALGLTALIFWQVLINVSMVTGLMPVVGIPLPFISYGGSSLITTMLAVGLLLNISMRRFMFQE